MAIKMSFQKGKGYKKSIGFHTSKNGQRKQKMFWLGKNEQKAEILCLTITSKWKELKNAAAEVWDEKSLDYIEIRDNIIDILQCVKMANVFMEVNIETV